MQIATSINQTQQLLMSQQLQQAIKMLQLSGVELSTAVKEELEKNPLLSEAAADNISIPENARYEKVINYHSKDYVDNQIAQQSLQEYVREQISLEIRGQYEKIIALNLLEMLDEAGYVRGDLSKLSQALHAPLADIEQVLGILQKFSPTGIFARNLSECLALQLQEQQKLDDNYQLLLANLALIATGGVEEFLKKNQLTKLQFQEMMRTIRKLNPKPGASFTHNLTNYVLPEVYVYLQHDKLMVSLNHELLPKVLLNKKYYTQIREKTKQPLDRQYLLQQLQHANWLIKALAKRADSLLKVASAIVLAQSEFFHHGINSIKPLSIKEVANLTNLHESSVSRITSNKFMSTPLGVFAMKFFFSSKIEAENFEQDYSSTKVKNLIKELISKETTPISDQALSELLKSHNIHIARRTIAKYREAMHIPVSKIRKQQLLLN
jgi:RNA polymerase sigma-54 factor